MNELTTLYHINVKGALALNVGYEDMFLALKFTPKIQTLRLHSMRWNLAANY